MRQDHGGCEDKYMLCRILIALLALNSGLWAQALSGTIVGTVFDQAGGAVPGVRVTLSNGDTHFTRIVETNAAGQYSA